MNEFKGTPGPWAINRHGAIVGGAFHQYANGSAQSQVAMVTGTREVNEGEMRANALLIAAAPRLLAAAQRYLDFRHTSDVGMGCEYSGVHPETDLKNAIADALGK